MSIVPFHSNKFLQWNIYGTYVSVVWHSRKYCWHTYLCTMAVNVLKITIQFTIYNNLLQIYCFHIAAAWNSHQTNKIKMDYYSWVLIIKTPVNQASNYFELISIFFFCFKLYNLNIDYYYYCFIKEKNVSR